MIKATERSRRFDFTLHVRRLIDDMVARLPELSHVDPGRVAISFSQARSGVSHGMQASLTPMRFEGGTLIGEQRGRQYTVERMFDARGREYLYILTFFLPRFLNQPLQEKIVTVLHELWHIGPQFDGDLRRFEGRCYAHGQSQQQYDAQVAVLAKRWWSLKPPRSCWKFLELNFTELQQTHGRVVGLKLHHPRLVAIG